MGISILDQATDDLVKMLDMSFGDAVATQRFRYEWIKRLIELNEKRIKRDIMLCEKFTEKLPTESFLRQAVVEMLSTMDSLLIDYHRIQGLADAAKEGTK